MLTEISYFSQIRLTTRWEYKLENGNSRLNYVQVSEA